MQKNAIYRHPVAVLKVSLGILAGHPVIFYPFILIALLQLLALEMLYFLPRYPLVIFFGPVVRRIWHETFLHYPYNFILLPKLFFYSQLVIFVFFGAFFTAVAVRIIKAINDGKHIVIKTAIRDTLSQYVHIIIAAFLSLLAVKTLSDLFAQIYLRAEQIRSSSGVLFVLKTVIIHGAPYFQLLIAIIVTTVFAFVIPAIVIDRKKIHTALAVNFGYLWKSLTTVTCIVFFPMILYVPVLIMRNSLSPQMNSVFPEGQALIIVASIIVTLFIDAAVLVALTTFYLMKKEEQQETFSRTAS